MCARLPASSSESHAVLPSLRVTHVARVSASPRCPRVRVFSGERKYLLSFAGSLALDIVDISHFYYGVRQRVYKLFHDHPRFKARTRGHV